LIFIFAGVLIITSIIATAMATRRYSSRAVVEVMPVAPKVMDSMEQVESLGAGTKDIARLYYATQQRIVRSQMVMRRSLETLRQDHGITEFDEDDDPIMSLRKKFTLRMFPETTLFAFEVVDTDPERAALYANTIAIVYMENNLERGQIATKQALKWLEKEVLRYREEKLEADKRVHEYKYKNNLIDIEIDYESVQIRIGELSSKQNEIQTEIINLEVAVDSIQGQMKKKEWRSLAQNYADFKDQQRLSALLLRESELTQEWNKLNVYYLPEHPELKRVEQEVEGIENLIKQELNSSLQTMRTTLEELYSKKSLFKEEQEIFSETLKELDEKKIDLAFLIAEATRNETVFNELDARLSQVDLSQFTSANNIRFIDEAEPDFEPVHPNLMQNLILSIVLGLFGGAGLAFLVEFLDNSIKTTEDLEKMLGMSLLGVVPSLDQDDLNQILSNKERAIYAYTRQRSPIAEALRSIRTNIKFRTGDKKPLVLLVTSAVPQEGKSFMSSNLSAVMAMSGQKVLLIDADLRRPSIHRLFDLADSYGTVNVLQGEMSFQSVAQDTHVPGLKVVAAGTPPSNPNELLGNGILQKIRESASEFDVIIIDTPPVTAVSDPMVLSPMVDGVVLVVEANGTKRPVVKQAVSRLKGVNAPLLGGVVNKFDSKRSGYGYYYYYADYGYYAEEEVLDAENISSV
jgi:capsular exopolysaccharide synthesis family protein